ncbi:hypothetical protein LXL04_015632 [Taraxacum kok-saghyz]
MCYEDFYKIISKKIQAKKNLPICKVFEKKNLFFRKKKIATDLKFERFLAPEVGFSKKLTRERERAVQMRTIIRFENGNDSMKQDDTSGDRWWSETEGNPCSFIMATNSIPKTTKSTKCLYRKSVKEIKNSHSTEKFRVEIKTEIVTYIGGVTGGGLEWGHRQRYRKK